MVSGLLLLAPADPEARPARLVGFALTDDPLGILRRELVPSVAVRPATEAPVHHTGAGGDRRWFSHQGSLRSVDVSVSAALRQARAS